MKRLALAVALCAGVWAGMPGTASAWLKFKNSTPNPVFVGHAYSSVSGFLCGYNDGCSGSDGDWRVQGWWQIAPGSTVTVHNQGYGNAMHDFYADDAFGHVWGGGGGTYCSPFSAFDLCSNICIAQGGEPAPSYTYRRIRGTRCCGGTCPSDHTVNLVL